MEDILLYFSVKYKGDFHKILKALKTKEKTNPSDVIKTKKSIHSFYTTIISDDYPERLKQIDSPPFVLYYYGNLSLLNEKTIAVIGSRIPDDYGINVTKKFVKDLVKNNYTIVSGMARGIDTIAHQSTISNHGKTIAILGSGIDYCYPANNLQLYNTLKNNHLVISEYPLDLEPRPYYFPVRNRIIAGLSDSLLVTQAKVKSGTMITVGHGLDQGKNIYCIPGRIDDPGGCNALILQGAKLVMDVRDIIEDQ